MSTNTFVALRALLLPSSPLLIATVVQVNSDDTSTVELPLGLGTAVYGGLAVGTRLRVRGSSAPVGARVFIRGGVIETLAPAGVIAEAVIGTVAALPFGPPRLAAAADPVPATVVPIGVAFALDLSAYWRDGYAPRAYAVIAGTLPTGLALRSATGVLAGTVAAAAAVRAITVRCADSTGRAVSLAPFNLSAA